MIQPTLKKESEERGEPLPEEDPAFTDWDSMHEDDSEDNEDEDED